MIQDKDPRPAPRWAQAVDVSAKLIAALAVVGAAFVANEYQSSMTSVSLLAKREEAESAMRAKMFSDLIGPITGPDKNQKEIPVSREQLMVELLALNFHEHFELKPLMLRVDERLKTEEYFKPNKKTVTEKERNEARDSLKSIARRVIQRQIALLTKEDADLDADERSCIYQVEIGKNQSLTNSLYQNRCLQTIKAAHGELISLYSPNNTYKMNFFVKPLTQENWDNREIDINVKIHHACYAIAEEIIGDDRKNAAEELRIVEFLRNARIPPFDNEAHYLQSVKLSAEVTKNADMEMNSIEFLQKQAIARWKRIRQLQMTLKKLKENGSVYVTNDLPDAKKLKSPDKMSALPPNVNCKTDDNKGNLLNSNYMLEVDSDFSLTPFDFPFTDNTLLADGTRFAVVIDKVAQKEKSLAFKIIWFPKNYIAARERPINFGNIRNQLGLNFSN